MLETVTRALESLQDGHREANTFAKRSSEDRKAERRCGTWLEDVGKCPKMLGSGFTGDLIIDSSIWVDLESVVWILQVLCAHRDMLPSCT